MSATAEFTYHTLNFGGKKAVSAPVYSGPMPTSMPTMSSRPTITAYPTSSPVTTSGKKGHFDFGATTKTAKYSGKNDGGKKGAAGGGKKEGTPPPSRPAMASCLDSSECPPDNACETGTCVPEAPLRFSLVWQGDDDLTLSITPNAGASFTDDIAGSPTDGDSYVESVTFTQSFNAGDLFEISVCQNAPGNYLDDYFTVKALEDSNMIAQFLGVFYNEDDDEDPMCQRFVYSKFG